jgi:predicted kinase
MRPKLFLMFGYPGAGKTTVAKLICSLTGARYLSSDETRLALFSKPTFNQAEHDLLYKKLDDQLIKQLKSGHSVVYDANLNRKVHREEKYKLAAKLEVTPVLVWVKTPKDLAKKRRINDSAHHKLVPSNETPEAMFDRVAGIFEEPEGEDYISITGENVTSEIVNLAINK